MTDPRHALLKAIADMLVLQATAAVHDTGRQMGIQYPEIAGILGRAMFSDLVASALVCKITREQFIEMATRSFDNMVKGRDAYNAAHPEHPECPTCGMRHPDTHEHGASKTGADDVSKPFTIH